MSATAAPNSARWALTTLVVAASALALAVASSVKFDAIVTASSALAAMPVSRIVCQVVPFHR